MRTDSLFYRLFLQNPAFALQLLGLSDSGAGYRFTSVEVKQTSFRLDGVFLPPAHHRRRPRIFVEVQFQADPQFYARLFSEITLYLHQHPRPNPWYALILYPERCVECLPGADFAPFLHMPQVRRLYLSDYQDIEPDSGLVWQLLKLISARDVQETISVAQHLTQTPENLSADTLNLIETVLAYRLPHLSLEEIHAMLNIYELNEIRLEDTQFYKDVARIEGEKARREWLARGMEKGMKKGLQKGREEGQRLVAINLLKLGMLTNEQIAQSTGLPVAEVEKLRLEQPH